MIRALIFAAVSSEEQAQPDKPSLDQQLRECHAVCESHGWTPAGEIRIDGHSRNYTRLDQLIGDCAEYGRFIDVIESGNVHVVVASSYDRLWRTDALRAQVAAICQDSDVRIFSCAEPVPLDAPIAAYWMQLFSGAGTEMAQRERVRNLQRGMRGRVENKGLFSTGEPPYGYKKISVDQPLVIEEAEAAWYLFAFNKMLDEHWPFYRVIYYFDKHGVKTRRGYPWSLPSLRYVMKNPFPAGGVRYRRWSTNPRTKRRRLLEEIINWNTPHQPLVSRERWEMLQRIIKQRAKAFPKSDLGPWDLANLVRCGYCHYTASRSRTPYNEFVRCGKYLATGGRECQVNQYYLAATEAFVLAEVKRVLSDPDAWLEAQQAQRDDNHDNAEFVALQARLRDVEERVRNVYNAIESGHFDLSALASRYDTLIAEKGAIQSRLKEIAGNREQLEALRRTMVTLANVSNALDDMQPEERNAIYKLLIDTIYIRREEPRVEIVWFGL